MVNYSFRKSIGSQLKINYCFGYTNIPLRLKCDAHNPILYSPIAVVVIKVRWEIVVFGLWLQIFMEFGISITNQNIECGKRSDSRVS